MKTMKKIMAVGALPLLALSLVACSTDKKADVEEVVTEVQSGQAQSGEAQSGDIEVVDIDELVEQAIGSFELNETALAYTEASSDSENIGILEKGTYPLMEVDGDWKGLLVTDGLIVWTDSNDGEITMKDDVTDDVIVEEDAE